MVISEKSTNSILKSKKVRALSAVLLLLLLCFLTYGDILNHHFMMDERIFVKPTSSVFANQRIYQDPASTVYTIYKHLGDYFTKPLGHHYAPFYYILNVALFTHFQTPFPLYLINLLLFMIDCGLLFVFIYLVTTDIKVALLTSVLFCIHPMTGDMLQHITLNILLIEMILIEAALITLFLYSKNNKHLVCYFFSLAMIIIASFCHEMVLLFPLYAAALLFFLTDLGFKRIIKLFIPFAVISGLLVIFWLIMVNPGVHLEKVKMIHPNIFWSSSANFSYLFFWYISNLFVPRNIVFMYNMPPISGSFWIWNFFLFSFLIGCGWLMCCHFKRSLESFALVLFLIGFLIAIPASQTRPEMGGVFEPNWVYFSSIGFYLFMVLMLLRIKKIINRVLFILLLSVLFIYYFAATLELNVQSRTEISYAQYWLRNSPGNGIARNIVASFYNNHKEIRIPSDLIPEMLDLVDTFINGNDSAAIDLMERLSTCDLTPLQRNELIFKLAAYHCKNDHPDQCEKFSRLIIGTKHDPFIYIQFSYTLFKSGANKTAIKLLKECMALYPKYKEPYLLIGVILGNDKHYEESIHYWQQGLAIDPTDGRFISNINVAKALINKGR